MRRQRPANTKIGTPTPRQRPVITPANEPPTRLHPAPPPPTPPLRSRAVTDTARTAANATLCFACDGSALERTVP